MIAVLPASSMSASLSRGHLMRPAATAKLIAAAGRGASRAEFLSTQRRKVGARRRGPAGGGGRRRSPRLPPVARLGLGLLLRLRRLAWQVKQVLHRAHAVDGLGRLHEGLDLLLASGLAAEVDDPRL